MPVGLSCGHGSGVGTAIVCALLQCERGLLVSAVVLFLCLSAQLGVGHSLVLFGCCVLEWHRVGRRCASSVSKLWAMAQLWAWPD